MDERLTIRTKHSAVLRKTVNPKGGPLRKAIRRLADYEDTGLMPEDVLKLKAEKEELEASIKLSGSPFPSDAMMFNKTRREASRLLHSFLTKHYEDDFLTPDVFNAITLAADELMNPREDVSQIKWERDHAIEQLDLHCIPFCGVVDPLDIDELLECFGPIWIECHNDFIEAGLVKNVDEEQGKATIVFVETSFDFSLNEYNRSWRAWYERPTPEDCNAAIWEE